MCLKSRFADQDELNSHIPGDEFYCYKLVNQSGGFLVSPHYSEFRWTPGVMLANCADRSNGDAGIYVFAAPIGVTLTKVGDQWSHQHGANRILRVRCRREDIVWGGEDNWGAAEGATFVMKKVEVLQEDFDKAMDPNYLQAEVTEILVQAQKNIEKAKKRVTKTKEKAETQIKKAKKKSAKRKETQEKKAKKTIKKAKKKLAKKAAKPRGYLAMNVEKLRFLAKKRGIFGYSKMTKAELVDALKK